MVMTDSRSPSPRRSMSDQGELRDAAFRGDEAASRALAEDVCDQAGHDWADAGGGLEICGWCAAERWA